ncbi:MAG: metal-dependent hydrolase [Planctomycetes bacterium]|nr:metal-dependent hydrolase [Planctomycetota bacterium]
MDNLTHALIGAAIAKTPLGARVKHAALAAMVAANLPDADVVLQLFHSQSVYLTEHRGITHSIVGVVLLAPWVAWVHWLSARRSGTQFGAALTLAFAAVASHPIFDALNSFGVRPFLPFDGTRYYGDTVFLVDPWLWLALGGAVALSGERTRLGSLLLGVAALATVVALAWFTRNPLLAAAWTLAVGTIAVCRWAGVGRQRAGTVLATAGFVIGGYLSGMHLASERARDDGTAWLAPQLAADEVVESVAANPSPLDSRAWRVFVMSQRFVHVVEWRLGDGPGTYRRLDRGEEDAFVERALFADCSAPWRSFARFPHAGVEEDATGRTVHLMDARYQYSPGAFVHDPSGERRGPIWSEFTVTFDDDGHLLGCGD